MTKLTTPLALHLTIGLTSVGALTPVPVRAQERDAAPAPVIRTSGIGEVTLEPDRAALGFGIQLRGPTAEELLDQVANIQASVIDTLSSLGVPTDSLQVDQLQAWPRWTGEGRDRQREYHVAATISFRTDALDEVPAFIEAALAAGVGQSSGIRWEASTAEDARAEALRLAFAAARRDAQALADAAGGSLGALVEVGTTGGPAVERFTMEAAFVDSPAARAAVGPTPQPVVVRHSVTASWRLVTPS